MYKSFPPFLALIHNTINAQLLLHICHSTYTISYNVYEYSHPEFSNRIQNAYMKRDMNNVIADILNRGIIGILPRPKLVNRDKEDRRHNYELIVYAI